MSNYCINVINTAHMVTGFLSVIYGVFIASIITVTEISRSIESEAYYIKYIKYRLPLLILLILILIFIFTSPIN